MQFQVCQGLSCSWISISRIVFYCNCICFCIILTVRHAPPDFKLVHQCPSLPQETHDWGHVQIRDWRYRAKLQFFLRQRAKKGKMASSEENLRSSKHQVCESNRVKSQHEDHERRWSTSEIQHHSTPELCLKGAFGCTW